MGYETVPCTIVDIDDETARRMVWQVNTLARARGSLASRLYGSLEVKERHRHRWEVNPDYWDRLEGAGVEFTGWSPDGRLKEMMERPENYFFFATQFHPEFKSRPWDPSPPYYGLVKACLDKKLGRPEPVY